MADKKAMESRRPRYKNTIHLWEFLMELLEDDQCNSIITWTRKEYGEFKLKNQEEVARRWGKIKQRSGMNYDKLSRALRYYYQKDIIKKVPEQRLVYRFHKLPYEYRPIGQRRDLSRGQKRYATSNINPPTTTLQAPVMTSSALLVRPLEIGHHLSAFHPPCTSACISGHFCRGFNYPKPPHSLSCSSSQIMFPPHNHVDPSMLGGSLFHVVKQNSVPTKVIQTRTR